MVQNCSLETKPVSMAANSTITLPLGTPHIQIPSLADTYGAFFIGSCISLVYVILLTSLRLYADTCAYFLQSVWSDCTSDVSLLPPLS